MTHTYSSLDSSTKYSFNRAIHLFATNEDVNNHNRHWLASLNHPIACSVVVPLSRKCYNDANEEKLEAELLILVGARVMLTSNLWIDVGLVNGALGIIEKNVYNLEYSPPSPPQKF
jgi:ATP-dependent DNA helicase PIF1